MSHSDFVGITDNGALCDANGHVWTAMFARVLAPKPENKTREEKFSVVELHGVTLVLFHYNAITTDIAGKPKIASA